MNLENVPNLRLEDFPSQYQDLLGKLFIQLTPFFASLNQVFANNIDYDTNFKSVTQKFNIKSVQPFSISWPFQNSPPQDVRIIGATKGQNSTPASLLLSWSFNASTSLITVSSMFEASNMGVTAASGSYQYTVRATI